MTDLIKRLLAMRATSPDPAALEDAVREIERLRSEAEVTCAFGVPARCKRFTVTADMQVVRDCLCVYRDGLAERGA